MLRAATRNPQRSRKVHRPHHRARHLFRLPRCPHHRSSHQRTTTTKSTYSWPLSLLAESDERWRIFVSIRGGGAETFRYFQDWRTSFGSTLLWTRKVSFLVCTKLKWLLLSRRLVIVLSLPSPYLLNRFSCLMPSSVVQHSLELVDKLNSKQTVVGEFQEVGEEVKGWKMFVVEHSQY